MSPQLHRSVTTCANARTRRDAAARWAASAEATAKLLVVAPSPEAGIRVLREAIGRDRAAVFGWQRATPGELWARLAAPALARRGLVQVGHVVLEALSARVVHQLRARGELGRFQAVGDRPGLAHALAKTMSELALAEIDSDRLPQDLMRIVHAYRDELAQQGLADRADLLRAAVETIESAREHPL
ncbi:MAG: PD-(D/E)XK nuclease family protein, partial [Sandaracinaceae bacterium]|nr:PD-(D/E)XK nuclease family protein [Sandaracinaceae bacterium]